MTTGRQMAPHQPRVKMSRLRDIGWNLWDPIGLLGNGSRRPGKWDSPDNAGFADEYDRYLRSAAFQLREGIPAEKVVNYLIEIETEYMGLGMGPSTRKRAEAVVAAILEDDSIWTWPNDEGKFE